MQQVVVVQGVVIQVIQTAIGILDRDPDRVPIIHGVVVEIFLFLHLLLAAFLCLLSVFRPPILKPDFDL